MVWGINGTPNTLGSDGDTLNITDLTAKKFNQTMIHALDSGAITDYFHFNANETSVYAYRNEENGGTDATNTGTSLWNTAADGEKLVIVEFCRISGEETLGFWNMVDNSSGTGAATAPSRRNGAGKYVTDEDITGVSIDNVGAGSFLTGSQISELGTD